MSGRCTPSRVALFLGISAASLLVGCHGDDTTTSTKALEGQKWERTQLPTNEPLSARALAPPDTSEKAADPPQQAEGEFATTQAVLERGVALEQSGQLQEALRVYDRALERPEAPLEVLERKALVQSWLKRLEESKVSYQLLLSDPRSDEPRRRRARLKLVELLAWESKFNEAINDLDRLLTLDPTNCDARLLHGQIREWQGRYREAKVTYSKILETYPQHGEARRRLDKLLWVP